MWLPAILHSLAFGIALNIHNLSSVLSGAWFMLLFAGCAVLVKDGYPDRHGLWYACALWLSVLMVSCYVLAPMASGAGQMWALAAMPMLAMCIKKENFNIYLISLGGIILLYAIGLIYQFAFNIHQPQPYEYHWFDVVHPAVAWPLINPNNAAAIINCALIPCFWLGLKANKWRFPAAIFALALIFTASKAGILAAVVACAVIFISERGVKWWFGLIFAALTVAVMSPIGAQAIKSTWDIRASIWKASLPLAGLRPLTGMGMGSFAYYYAQVRTEFFTAGYWAHNDALQIAIEMGIPALIAFCWMWFEVLCKVSRRNLPAACVIVAVLFQSMLEFQIFVPAISMLLGLAVAWYYHHTEYEIW